MERGGEIMNNKLLKVEQTTLSNQYQWRDRKGNLYLPSEMETKHLFFTLLMIWNHSVPDIMRIKPYQKYQFNKFYTEEYIRDSVRHIFKELTTRKDINPIFTSKLHQIKTKINEYKKVKELSNE